MDKETLENIIQERKEAISQGNHFLDLLTNGNSSGHVVLTGSAPIGLDTKKQDMNGIFLANKICSALESPNFGSPYLTLDCCGLRTHGSIMIAKTLETNSIIERLQIQHDTISLSQVAEMVGCNSKMKILDLKDISIHRPMGCSFEESFRNVRDDMRALVAALKCNTTLQELHFTGHGLDRSFILMLQDIVPRVSPPADRRQDHVLGWLWSKLDQQGMPRPALWNVQDMLRSQSRLKTLYLDALPDDDKESLRLAFSSNPSFYYLQCGQDILIDRREDQTNPLDGLSTAQTLDLPGGFEGFADGDSVHTHETQESSSQEGPRVVRLRLNDDAGNDGVPAFINVPQAIDHQEPVE